MKKLFIIITLFLFTSLSTGCSEYYQIQSQDTFDTIYDKTTKDIKIKELTLHNVTTEISDMLLKDIYTGDTMYAVLDATIDNFKEEYLGKVGIDYELSEEDEKFISDVFMPGTDKKIRVKFIFKELFKLNAIMINELVEIRNTYNGRTLTKEEVKDLDDLIMEYDELLHEYYKSIRITLEYKEMYE